MTEQTVYLAGATIFFLGSGLFFIASKILLKPYHSLNYVMLAVPLTAATAYLVMSTGFGLLANDVGAVNVTRYADWLITTPILLYILTYALYQGRNKVQRKNFLIIGGLDILMLLTGLGAEMSDGNLRTLLFSVSSLTYLFLLYLIVDAMLDLSARESSPQLKNSTLGMAWTILIIWSIYPFVWIFSPQGLSVLSEFGVSVSFLFLDLLSKFVFSGLLLYYLFVTRKLKYPSND